MKKPPLWFSTQPQVLLVKHHHAGNTDQKNSAGDAGATDWTKANIKHKL